MCGVYTSIDNLVTREPIYMYVGCFIYISYSYIYIYMCVSVRIIQLSHGWRGIEWCRINSLCCAVQDLRRICEHIPIFLTLFVD